MPIRSPRGRAAAYRALWQWPLRSPARLAATVAVVAVVAVVASTLLTAVAGPTGSVGPAPGSSAAGATGSVRPSGRPSSSRTPAPTALPPVADLTPSARPVSSAPAASLEVAARWAAAWVRPPEGTTAAQWLDGLRPTTTAEYLGVLATVDPAAIPATRVTGEPRPTQVSANAVQVQIPTDALTLVVLVVVTEDGDWRVTDHDRI